MSTLNRFAAAKLRILTELQKMQPGDGRCLRCGWIAPQDQFYRGRGRQVGEHPDHLFCGKCHQSVTWCGFAVKGSDGKVRRVA